MNISRILSREKKIREANAIEGEVERILANIGAVTNYSTRVRRKVAQRLLLKGSFFSHGRCMKIKAKSVGCGIYEITGEDT